ncbi:methyltransferase domain-containing protein [Chitinivorax sp. PXF-14]|uniref:class I SAM-dependent methyltransferase n=1 Tax=Chitinivorax sp. PXF-14 TaxID=3230488 RepID=UPI00346630AD
MSIDAWLSVVEQRIERDAPELRRMFDIYAAEARFGRQFIADDLNRLPHSARVLEVGAGAYLLSCQLVREGFLVTALEPVGEGFSHFSHMQDVVVGLAREMQCLPCIVATQAEKFVEHDRYDFAFSINVMEHVRDVETTLGCVANSLLRGAWYRFTCPNYAFPYEPHFSMPTLLSKRLTERCMGKHIFNNKTLPDPVGTWRSLNWIKVTQIMHFIRQRPELSVQFDRNLMTRALERIADDPEFAARRSALLRYSVTVLVRIGLHRLPALLPASMLPIMDCRIQKNYGELSQ